MKKKIGYIVLLFIFFFLVCISFNKENQGKKENPSEIITVDENDISYDYGDVSNQVNPGTWVAIDGLGRELTTNKTNSDSHPRYVGIFYWTWHAYNDHENVVNVNNVNKENPTHKNDYDWWTDYVKKNPGGNMYWWNESIYNYYLSEEYVLRKQAELLADAGVDFVVFDCTNGDVNYTEPYERLLKVWKEAKNNGVNVPKIAFMFPFSYSYDTYDAFMYLYNRTYDPNSSNYKNYNDLYFKYDGKPLVLLSTDGAPSDMKAVLSNFTYRAVNTGAKLVATGAQSNGVWGWLCSYPQAYYKKANGKPEQITVGVAQNIKQTYSDAYHSVTCMNGSSVMGRSYAKNNYSYSFNYKNSKITVGSSITGATAKSTNTSFYGRNFQQQWDYAREIDPEVVFVTGWNEWIMGRYKTLAGVNNCFSDEFNDEYSRDIEPSKGELKDYYYYQLVDNIRKYKGVSAQTSQNTPVTINNTSDWNNSNIINYNHYTGGYQRDSIGAAKNHYVNKTFRNDIKKAKVSYDASYIYFYVETVDKLNAYNSDKWMRLLIDTRKNNDDQWEEFEYIVNRTTGNSSKLILEKSNGGWNFSKVGEVDYKVTNNVLEIKIRREYIEQTGSNINFNFKWSDNNLKDGDIMTIYTDGDAAPGGRFAFKFSGTAAYQQAKETTVNKGDINSDGKINSQDYILVRKKILNLVTLTEKEAEAADMNSDGKVNSQDYILVRKKIMNGETTIVTPTMAPIPTPAPTPKLTGWQKIDGKWYYYNNNGSTLKGWQKLSWSGGTSWFYFDLSNGIMVENTTKTIDGKKYQFNANGVCTTMPDCKT